MLAGVQLNSLTITKLVPAGIHVKKGDVLAEFDRQAQVKDFFDKQAEYENAVAQVAEEQAKQEVALAKDETELKQAENKLKDTELKMQKLEILSRIEAEKTQQTLEEAKATLRQLRETFDLKRKAARAAIRILEIKRDRTRESMLHAQANSEQMIIRAPVDGTVVLHTMWNNGRMAEFQEGDQVQPGVSFMEVVDPSIMQVRAPVNQQDVLAIQVGQRVQIRLDAYPDLVFSGKLEQLAPMGKEGTFSDRVRTFGAVFSITGADPRLMPDLSAAVDVPLDRETGLADKSRTGQ
jgi:multidrug resistance efflux pump